ncbi:Outer membrane protein assembly factor BamB [Polystyrenella longa]|uniref:Outer membrane protein assembly factor BamB n=1 Tax=Polystyrenella longa TaxID=2528007 RepID=A0A518CKG9_9PLAN|nr:PQQ-binding-like beta-propeller repeat protein [Polystyrenella longa]QDU79716.1 Outer membrane protein assembly factor BamB [Polystyrenella longa]
MDRNRNLDEFLAPDSLLRSVFSLLLSSVLVLCAGAELSAQDGNEQPEQAQPGIQNLLKKARQGLQNLLGPFGDNEDLEEIPEDAVSGQFDITRDPHAPVKNEIANLWRRTEKNIAAGEFQQGYELLHHILTRTDEDLMYSPDGKLISLRLLAQEKLNDLPEEYRQTYIKQYDLLSQKEYQQALKDNDFHKIYEIASRYLLTEGGQKGANWLGAYHLDHGRYGLAAYWFNLLREQDARITQSFHWQSRLLLAFSAAQKEREAEQLLSEITQAYPNESDELRSMLEMWDQKIVLNTASQTSLEEWAVPFGSAGRNGIAAGGDPILTPRWEVERTNDQLLQEQIEALVETLVDDQESLVIPNFPVFMDGFAAFKTLRGLVVIDAETGHLEWETQEEYSPEEIVGMVGDNELKVNPQAIRVNGRVQIRVNGINARGVRRMMNQFDTGLPATYNPLVRLIFKNATYGMVSCDKQRVYTLEDVASIGGPENDWGGIRNGNFIDPFHRDWNTNKLAAYDLRSGRKHWAIGGADHDDEFDNQMAGYFFHSTPVVYRNELLVIAEKQNEIQLLALAPQTGALLWKQLIAFSDTDISIDVMRRYMGGQVAVADGVIVCPTAAGWLVGVDAMTHSVLWANRYHRGDLDEESARSWRRNYDVSEQLGDWKVTPPFISQNSVVYAPPEGESLNCYDLQTGEQLWGSQHQGRDPRRQDALFVAGVWGELVLVVENTQMAAYDLKQGRRVWKHAYTESMGKPAGFGVMNESSYYLPFDSGQLLKLRLDDGMLEETFNLASHGQQGKGPLGNLSLYQGKLLSYSWKGLQNFEQREFVAQQIEKRKSKNAQDPFALLKEAEISLMDHDYLKALQKLRGIDLSQIGAELKPEFQEVLRRVFRSEKISRTEDLEWGLNLLEEQATEAQDHLLSQQLRIANDLLAEDTSKAFSRGVELISFVRKHPDIYLEGDGRFGRKARVDVWLASELQQIWNAAANSGVTAGLAEQIEPLLAEADPQDVKLLQLYSRLFHFYEPIEAIQENLAQQLSSTDQWQVAERIWRNKLTRPQQKGQGVDLEQINQYRTNLVQLMKDRGLETDAIYYEQLPAGTDRSEVLDADVLTEELNPLTSITGRGALKTSWAMGDTATDGHRSLTLRRLGVGHSSYENTLLAGRLEEQAQLPWFRLYHPRVTQKQRVSFVHTTTGETYWSVPLRGERLSGYGEDCVMTSVEHLFVIQHGEMISVISPVDQSVLWTQRLSINNSDDLYQHMREFRVDSPLQGGKHALSEYLLSERKNEFGMIAFVNSEVIGVYGRHRLDVLDVMTGKRLWSLTDLPRETNVTGNRDVVFVRRTDPDTGRVHCDALSTRDGRLLEIDKELIENALYCNDHYFVTVDYETRTDPPANGEDRGQRIRLHVIKAVDLQTKEVFWTQEINAESKVSFLPSGLLLALDEEGVLSEIDLNLATVFRYQSLTKEQLESARNYFVLIDEEQVYLVGSRNGGRYADYAHIPIREMLKALPVDGGLYCFDRQSGKLNWSSQLKEQQLIVGSVYRSPWLVFASGQELDDESNFQDVVLEVLDRQQGKQLLKTDLAIEIGNNLVSFRVFPEKQVAELTTDSHRYQIGFADTDADAGKGGAEKPDPEEGKPATDPASN